MGKTSVKKRDQRLDHKETLGKKNNSPSSPLFCETEGLKPGWWCQGRARSELTQGQYHYSLQAQHFVEQWFFIGFFKKTEWQALALGGITTAHPTPTLMGRVKTHGKWKCKRVAIMNQGCLELELGIRFVWFVLFSFIGDEKFQLSELVKWSCCKKNKNHKPHFSFGYCDAVVIFYQKEHVVSKLR